MLILSLLCVREKVIKEKVTEWENSLFVVELCTWAYYDKNI